MVDLGLSLSFTFPDDNPVPPFNSLTPLAAAAAAVTPPVTRDDHDGERACSRGISDEEDCDCSRKKLRLTKDQSYVLEETFKQHNTLNLRQKQSIAKRLRLTPRQVEVWFQNRRARTKLKQTEIDYEFLKRCCDTLTEENRRLQKEIQELKALKLTNGNGAYMQMKTPPPAATAILNICPSCERVAVALPAPASPPINIWGRPVGGLCTGL